MKIKCPYCESTKFTRRDSEAFITDDDISIPATCDNCRQDIVIIYESTIILEDV